MSGNKALRDANKAKEDEFYTRLEDIESELVHYKRHFRGKVVLCNCDDPYESNFFKYFAMNFNSLGLKKLIATSYISSPIARVKFVSPLWVDDSTEQKHPYRVDITEVKDFNGDGSTDLSDVEYLLKNDANSSTLLKEDGDFRSKECLKALDEADIVVTNPPFSLFREFVTTLIDHGKKFLIIGNQNAITYKEFFQLLKNNIVWLGYHNGDMSFMVPPEYEARSTRYWVDENGQKWRSLGTIAWYTNLDIEKRHETMDLIRTYSPESYPRYDNYNAIEVSKVADIPRDYMESMGVPVDYSSKFDRQAFSIVRHGIDSDGVYRTYIKEVSNSTESVQKTVITDICKGLGIPEEKLVWYNGTMSVPITFLDKYALDEFELIGLNCDIDDDPNLGRRFLLRERGVCQGTDQEKRMTLICKGLGIPMDQIVWCNGWMGVPITFLDKYSPDQFIIIGMAKRGAGDPALKSKVYTKLDYSNYSDLNAGPVLLTSGLPRNTYPRVLVMRCTDEN